MELPVKTNVPDESAVASSLNNAYFFDAWAIKAAEPKLDPLAQFLRILLMTPRWVDTLMKFRNTLVRPFGLKNLGTLSNINPDKASNEYRLGERIGIFTLKHSGHNEALLMDEDKHLDVVVSVCNQVQENGDVIVTVSTVVHLKNWLGRAYMLPVKPAHYMIAKAMTACIGNKKGSV